MISMGERVGHSHKALTSVAVIVPYCDLSLQMLYLLQHGHDWTCDPSSIALQPISAWLGRDRQDGVSVQ